MIESLVRRIRDKWVPGYYPRLPETITAASLAHHGFLRSVEYMWLHDVDLICVLVEHQASLTACVWELVGIWNVSNPCIMKKIVLRTWNEEEDVPTPNLVPREVAGLVDLLSPHDVPKSSKRSRNSTKVDVLGKWVVLEALR